MCSSLRSQSETGFLGVLFVVRPRTWLYPDPVVLVKCGFDIYRIQKDLMAGAHPTAMATKASIVLEPKISKAQMKTGEGVSIIQEEDWCDQLSAITR